jgi:hypothetical protein
MKTPLLIVFLWSASTFVHAGPAPGVAFKGGLNATTLDEDLRVDRYGFSGGLAGVLRWALGERFSLAGQMDILYTPRGAETIFEGQFAGRVRSHYLDVIFAVRPEVRLGPASLYLLLGGGPNLLIGATKENVSGPKEDITDDLHRVDVALLVGVGAAWHLPRRGLGPLHLGTLFLEARHDHGLLDTDAVNGGFKNRASSLMLGMSFALGSRAGKPPPPSPPTPDPFPAPAVGAAAAE